MSSPNPIPTRISRFDTWFARVNMIMGLLPIFRGIFQRSVTPGGLTAASITDNPEFQDNLEINAHVIANIVDVADDDAFWSSLGVHQ